VVARRAHHLRAGVVGAAIMVIDHVLPPEAVAHAVQGDVTAAEPGGSVRRVPELELTRTRDDRKVYALEGVGTLRLSGWLRRSATAQAGDRSWEIARRGVLRPATEATDEAGAVAGTFRGRGVRRGGTLAWEGRELTLRPASAWRERYALAEGERELAVFDGKGWGKRPVAVRVDDPAAIDAGLLLFTAFVVRGLAEDAGATGAGAATTSAAATG
jgi:hypothetical protein